MTDLTHEQLVADVAYIIASNKSEKAGYAAGLIISTIAESLKEPTTAMLVAGTIRERQFVRAIAASPLFQQEPKP